MRDEIEYEDLMEDFYVEAPKHIPKISEGTYTAEIETITIEKDVETTYAGVSKTQDMYWFTFKVNGSSVRKRYTKSVHEKSNLYKTIKTLTGDDPRNGYDVRHLVGLECLVTIVHNEDKRGNIWENIEAVMPALN